MSDLRPTCFCGIMIWVDRASWKEENVKDDDDVDVAERSPVCKTLKSFPKQWERAAQLPRLGIDILSLLS